MLEDVPRLSRGRLSVLQQTAKQVMEKVRNVLYSDVKPRQVQGSVKQQPRARAATVPSWTEASPPRPLSSEAEWRRERTGSQQAKKEVQEQFEGEVSGGRRERPDTLEAADFQRVMYGRLSSRPQRRDGALHRTASPAPSLEFHGVLHRVCETGRGEKKCWRRGGKIRE